MKLTISKEGINELFCIVIDEHNGEVLSLKPEYINLRKYLYYWGREDIEDEDEDGTNYLKHNNLYYSGNSENLEIYKLNVFDYYVEFDEIFVFDFPEDYPEEELFYFKLKYC